MRTLYVDVETSGLNEKIHGIIELGYIIEDDNGEVLDKGYITMNPLYMSSKVSPKALEINGFSVEDLTKLPNAKEACVSFIAILNKHLDDKYKLVAYNADFDTKFIQAWMDKLVPNTYWKMIDYKHLDPFAMVKYLQHLGKIDTGKSQSLESVAKYFNLEHKAHNALSDIEVTRDIHHILINKMNCIDKHPVEDERQTKIDFGDKV